jgi:hypothetical protein
MLHRPGQPVSDREVIGKEQQSDITLTRGRLVKNVPVQHREAFWQDTREQLKSAQSRGDFFTVLGLAVIGGLLWVYHEPGDGFGSVALAGIAFALIVICGPLWFVTRRKRSISAARLTCPHCGHAPHDTEIAEVAETRQCQRCNQSLD